MKDQRDFGLCFICNKAPINRICLDEECIKTDSFLFCDGCRKNQNMRKFASQIYEIDSFSGPVSLFSINSYNKEEGERVSTNIKFCRQLAEDHVNKIYQKLVLIQDKSIEKLVELQGTFSVQSAQRVEELLKNAKRIDQGSFAQLLKKVKSLKWLRENKDIAENPKVLSQKIISYTKHFQECITRLTKKIQPLINEFLTEIDAQKIFEDDKKKQQKMNNKPKDLNVKKIQKKPKIVQKSQTSSGTKIISQSQNAPSKKQQSNQDLQRMNPVNEGMEAQNQEKLPYFSDGSKASSQPDRVSIFERIFPSTLPIINQSIHEEVESQKNHHQEEKKSGVIQQEQKSEPLQQERQVIRVVKKKPVKPNASERQPSEEQIKVPALVLQKLPTKADYRQDQILIINLRNIAEIFYFFSKNQQNPQPQDNDSQNHIKEQNSQEDMPVNQASINFKRGKMPEINLERIRYLQVQQLPRLQVQHFHINIDGEEKAVKYSLTQLYEKIEAMINLEQLHVFTSYLFPTEEQFPTVMCFCPNLKVISFNCYNLFSKALESYKGLIGDQRNQEMKVLEIAGNIPFCENLETFDIKMYFPESQKNRKIFDEYFAKNFTSEVHSQKSNHEVINEKDKFEHRNSCWWVPKYSSRLQKQRQPLILMPSENLMIASCFSQLRNCWIPYVETYQAQEKTINLQKIQHLSLGFHNFVLQAIPPDFFTKEKSFSKSLTNLKSLNLINLNLYEFVMKGFFNKQCKSLVSLKIQFCRGLSNSFYVSLPNYCPKLKKISVNNLSNDINTEFIMKFEELETIILPWAQFTQQKPIQNGFEKHNQQKLPNELNGNKQIHIQDNEPELQRLYVLKKFKYINFYGCKNFTTFFFTLVDLKYLEHLNLGKCRIADHQELIYFLKMCENLKSLCLDEAQLSNSQLFRILSRLPHLERLSLANCPNLDFTVDKLSETQVRMLDEMSLLDLRMKNKISCEYTLQMQKPKFLIISRGFDVQKNQLPILAKRQIYAYSWFNDSQDPYEY